MISFRPITLTDAEEKLRADVRAFVAETLPPGSYTPGLGIGAAASPEFSRKLGERGWLGMVVPEEYGGPGRTAVDRCVVVEELLAVGAPVGAHWVGDRQTAPMLLAYGTPEQKRRFLPAIVKGEVFFALGMSEPGSGSDLASVRTRATSIDGGWLLSGLKTWTSGAHFADHIIVLCRTSPDEGSRHAGLSQLLVDRNSDGVTVSPIKLLNGTHHFNEVLFDEVFVPDNMVLGQIGTGWQQVTTELAYERSGPDRYLSAFPLLQQFMHHGSELDDARIARDLGVIVARYWVLRNLSLALARTMDEGKVPEVEAALLKDVGTRFEQEVVRVVRRMFGSPPDHDGNPFERLLAEATITSPTFTLRGGTNEVLQTVAAKHLLRGIGGAK